MEIIDGNINMNTFMEYMRAEIPNTIVEIGCQDAVDSLLFKQNFPNARVIAIEGLPDNYTKHLKDITEVETYQMVINSYDGETIYHHKNQDGIHGIFDRGEKYGQATLTLECQRFDTFCKSKNITRVDAVKIDVEGATLEVLSGFGELLSTVRIMHIETENGVFFTGQKLQSDVQSFLVDKGFTLVLIAGANIEADKSQFDEIWVAARYGEIK